MSERKAREILDHLTGEVLTRALAFGMQPGDALHISADGGEIVLTRIPQEDLLAQKRSAALSRLAEMDGQIIP